MWIMEREKIQARVDTFRKFASQQGWSIAAEREINETTYQIKVTNGVSKVPIDFYRTGTVLIQGKPSELQSMLKSWWTQQKMQQHPSSLWDKDSLSTQGLPPPTLPITPKVVSIPRAESAEA